jgi:hypothetical protein
MQLKTPTNLVFYITVALAALGFIGAFVAIPFVSGLAFWFILVAFAVLALGVTVKGF